MQLAWKKLFFNEQNWRAANGVKTIWERLVIPYAVVNPDKILNNHEQPTFGLQCIMLRAALQQGSAIIGQISDALTDHDSSIWNGNNI